MKKSHCIPVRKSGIRSPAWANFIKHIKIEKYGSPYFTGNFSDWYSFREEKLAEFNATYDGKEIIFKTEKDKMFFLLRWS